MLCSVLIREEEASITKNAATNEYAWNGTTEDLAEFSLVCDLYDGDTVYGDRDYNCTTTDGDYKNVPLCSANVCSEADAIDVANFVSALVDECPLVTSFV